MDAQPSVSVAATFVVAFGLYFVLCYGLSRALAAFVVRTDWSLSSKGLAALYARLLLAVGAVSVAIVLHTEHLPVALLDSTILSARLESVGVVIEMTAVIGTTSLAGIYAIDRGLRPTIDILTERKHTTAARHHRRKWTAIGILIYSSVLVFFAIVRGVLPFHTASIPAAIGGFGVIAWYLSLPFAVVIPFESRDPSPAELARIERCYEGFGRTPGNVSIFERAPQGHDVAEAGRGAHQWTWIRESTLEEADDEELSVLLAQASEFNHSGAWSLISIVILLGMVGLFAGSNTLLLVDMTGPPTQSTTTAVVLTYGTLLSMAGIVYMIRRRFYQADDFACQHFDPDLVYRTYTVHCYSVVHVPDTVPEILQKLWPEPPKRRRLERLDTR